jgi:hypothetical protein
MKSRGSMKTQATTVTETIALQIHATRAFTSTNPRIGISDTQGKTNECIPSDEMDKRTISSQQITMKMCDEVRTEIHPNLFANSCMMNNTIARIMT